MLNLRLLKSHKSFGGRTEVFEHDSVATKSKMKFSVVRPEKMSDIKGGLVWLSGLTCTEENFIMKAGVQRFVEELGLVIICPDTSPRGLDLPGVRDSYDFGEGAGLYVDSLTEGYKKHFNMYSYVNDEIYNFLSSTYNLNDRISVLGHSMGGHGALVIGLRNKKYRSVSALAPIVNPLKVSWCRAGFKKYLGGDESLWRAYDSCALIESGSYHKNPILIDQGTEDEFLDRSLMTPNIMKVCDGSVQKIEVRYQEGFDHSYYFVASFIEEHMRFHLKHLV